MRVRPQLRFFDLVTYGVATSLSVRWMATAAVGGPSSLPLWVFALLAFMAPLVLATAELVGRFPGEGGLYEWARDAVSPFVGFLTGWLYWTCNLPFFSGILYFVIAVLAAAGGPHAQALARDPAWFAAAASAIALAVLALQLAGMGTSKWLTNAGALALAALIAALIIMGAAVAIDRGPATDFSHARWTPLLNADGAALWATMVFAYGGPESLAFLRAEVKGGTAGVLRVLAVIGVLQTAGYTLGTWGILAILRPAEVSRLGGVADAFTLALTRLHAAALAAPFLLALALAMMGGYGAWFTIAARLPFVVGADRYLPPSFGRRHPTTGAPVTALVVQGIAVVALVWLGEAGASVKAAYDFLVAMTVLSYELPFIVLFAVLIKTQNRPAAAGEWTIPGGPGAARLVGWIGLAATLTAIACTLVPSPDAADKAAAVAKLVFATAVLIGSGWVVWALGQRRARVRPAPETLPG
ncbi:MAG TPA: APC family permease [Caulobacteraceae bacterium]|nr:APC family permease [Caulobacteraceae bacterium]